MAQKIDPKKAQQVQNGIALSQYDKNAGASLLSGMTTNQAAQDASSGKVAQTSQKPNGKSVKTVRKLVDKSPIIKGGSLNEVVITGEAKKPMAAVVAATKPEEKKYTVGQYMFVGKNKYPKRELIDALKKENLLKYTGESYFNSDGRPLAEYVIKKYKIPVYNEALRTRAQADSIFATGKSN